MKKSTQKSLKNGAKMVPKMERNHGRCSGRRRTLRPRWAREAFRDPKLTILAPKMDPQSSKNENPKLKKKRQRDHRRHRKCNTSDRCLKSESETCRVIPKKIYVKKVLRRCSAQRAQSSKNASETDEKSKNK